MTRPRLFVTRALPSHYLQPAVAISDVDMWESAVPPSKRDLSQRERGADVVLCTITERLDGELLEQLPELRGIANLAVGCDNIDLDACRRRNIAVTNVPGVLESSVAELTFGLLLAVARRIGEASAAVTSGEWGVWQPMWMCGRDLRGSTLVVIGAGGIGSRVAQLGRAFEMNVVTYTRRSTTPLTEVLAAADVFTVHVPLTASTRHLLSRSEFRSMKPGAIVINTARGDVIDQGALLEAIECGRLGGAGLDVATPEPLPADHPLLRHPNVVVTPHIGSATLRTRAAMIELAVTNACDLLANRAPRHLVSG